VGIITFSPVFGFFLRFAVAASPPLGHDAGRAVPADTVGVRPVVRPLAVFARDVADARARWRDGRPVGRSLTVTAPLWPERATVPG